MKRERCLEPQGVTGIAVLTHASARPARSQRRGQPGGGSRRSRCSPGGHVHPALQKRGPPTWPHQACQPFLNHGSISWMLTQREGRPPYHDVSIFVLSHEDPLEACSVVGHGHCPISEKCRRDATWASAGARSLLILWRAAGGRAATLQGREALDPPCCCDRNL